MKLVGVMSLQEEKEFVRELFERHQVQIYSETAISGHTLKTIRSHGWFATDKELPYYSTLCFAIIDDQHAEAIMAEMERHKQGDDSEHPIRAFLVDVEKMI